MLLGVVPGKALSSEYIAANIDILKTQVMYGGYRLNLLLQSIYGSANQSDLFLQ